MNWKQFEGEFVELQPGIVKKLVLAHWKEDHTFERPGIAFDVIEEDEKKVKKIFVTRSRRLLKKLIPLLKEAEEQGKTKITISILRIGEGFDTSYVVKELDDSTGQ